MASKIKDRAQENDERYGDQEQYLTDFERKAREVAKFTGTTAGLAAVIGGAYAVAGAGAFPVTAAVLAGVHVATSVAVGGIWFKKSAQKLFEGKFAQAGKLFIRGATEAAVVYVDAALAVFNLPIKFFTGHYISSHIGRTTNQILDGADEIAQKGREKVGYWVSFVKNRDQQQQLAQTSQHNVAIEREVAREHKGAHSARISDEKIKNAINEMLGENHAHA